VQAVGAAMVVPTSLGLLYPAFARRQHALVVGIWVGVASVAASAGPPLGGLLVGIDWRWIFLFNVPIGVATLVAGWRVLPEVRAQRGTRLPDGVSAAVLLAAVTLLILGTVQGPVWGWTDPRTLGLLAAALVATVLTVARTIQLPHALVEKALFASRDFTFGRCWPPRARCAGPGHYRQRGAEHGPADRQRDRGGYRGGHPRYRGRALDGRLPACWAAEIVAGALAPIAAAGVGRRRPASR
jgi:MFS family permease